MSVTLIENRAYFTINGQKYPLSGLVKDIVMDTGNLSKHADGMTDDGSTPAMLLTNQKPTIQWTELIPTAANYVKLLSLLWSQLGATIVVQPFIIGDTTPSGEATMFTTCIMGNQNVAFPSQDTEGVRRIQINATSYTEL